MRDHIVRAAFHETVLQTAHLDQNTFVVDELGLKNGVIRADIAVLNGKLVGYEINTDKDNLNRLGPQINAYSEVFDQAYIISGKKHLSKVLDQVPCFDGIGHRTPYLSEPLSLILQINKQLQSIKKGEKLSLNNLSPLVAPKGIEPLSEDL
jgi:hypothetical protein